MQIESTRRKSFRAYKEFVRIWQGNLDKVIRVQIPVCCVKTICDEFPKTGAFGDIEYTGLKCA